MHVGIYCHHCQGWVKWLSKAEKKKYGIVTPDDLTKSNGLDVKQEIIDDVTLKQAEKNCDQYLNEELPWYD